MSMSLTGFSGIRLDNDTVKHQNAAYGPRAKAYVTSYHPPLILAFEGSTGTGLPSSTPLLRSRGDLNLGLKFGMNIWFSKREPC